MRHSIINEHKDVPLGYSTYSVLLIPDQGWFEKKSLATALEVFKRFKRFGEMLGDDHLAFWFYRDFFPYATAIDIEIVTAITQAFESEDELKQFVCSEIAHGKVPGQVGGYDTRRARLICAGLSLEYSKGPYIAFYTQQPLLPYYMNIKPENPHLPSGEKLFRPCDYTVPDLVLQFGGLSIDRVYRLLDLLEQQIIRDDISVNELRWKQIWPRIEKWCKKNRKSLISVLRALVARDLRELTVP